MRTFLLLGLGLFASGCDQTEEWPVRLEPGTRASYRYTFTQQAAGDSVAVPLEAYDVVQTVRSDRATVASETGLTEVVVTGGTLGESHGWYRVSATALDEVAYGPLMGPNPPLRTALADPSLPTLIGRRLADAGVASRGGYDSTLVRTPPRRVLVFPLTVGRTWTHFDLIAEGREFDFRSTRTVTGTRTVATADGARPCAVIRTDLFFDGSLDSSTDWDECHDADGLVEARITYRQIDAQGNPFVMYEHRLRTTVERPFQMQRR